MFGARDRFRLTLVAAVGACAVACSSPSPNAPSVSFVTPNALVPSNNSQFAYSTQPLSFSFANAQKTGAATTTYSVEVATDSGFANKVYTKDGIPENASGTTSFAVPVLPGNTQYFWHSRAVVNSVAGQFSTPLTFFVEPQITIQPPVPISPADGTNGVGVRPALLANDAVTSGPVNTLFYTFQISTDPTFPAAAIVATGEIQEQPGQTTYSPSADLPAGTYFWRVNAQDVSDHITSSFSSSSSFTVVPFNMGQATIPNSPFDLGFWTQTSSVTSVQYGGGAVVVDFDKRTGDNRWPDVIPPGFGGPLEYTLGLCLNLGGGGHWYCSAAIQYWFGRDPGASANIGGDWFYDPVRWGPMAGYQPAEGELVGWFAGEGNLRNDSIGVASPLRERTNVALIPFTGSDTLYTFANGRRTLSVKKR